MKYQEVIPIQTHPCSAWIVTEPSGTKKLMLYAPEALMEDIVRSGLITPGSRIQRIDVGEFVIQKILTSYSGDGRSVDTNFEVSI